MIVRCDTDDVGCSTNIGRLCVMGGLVRSVWVRIKILVS